MKESSLKRLETELAGERQKVEEAVRSLEKAQEAHQSNGSQSKTLQEQLALSQQQIANQDIKIAHLETAVRDLEGEKRQLLTQADQQHTSSTKLAKESVSSSSSFFFFFFLSVGLQRDCNFSLFCC